MLGLGGLAIAQGGLSLISSGMKFFEGRKMEKRAQEFIDNFRWQDLDDSNPYENMSVSTMGSDLRREEASRGLETVARNLSQAGTRALVGGLGRAQNQYSTTMREIGSDLDKMQTEIDYAAAQDEVAKRAMVERRQAEELQGYGQMLDVGRDMRHGALTDLVNTAGSMAWNQMAAGAGGAQGVPSHMGQFNEVPGATVSRTPGFGGGYGMYSGFHGRGY